MIVENLNEVHWHILFSQSFEELAKYSENMSCGQCEVSKCLAYRNILKSIVKKLKEKNQKFSFSKLGLNLSVHRQCAMVFTPDYASTGIRTSSLFYVVVSQPVLNPHNNHKKS